MKTINISKEETKIVELLAQAVEEDILLRLADGREFVLTIVDDFEDEIRRTRQNKELMQLLDKRGNEKKSIPFDEIESELGLN